MNLGVFHFKKDAINSQGDTDQNPLGSRQPESYLPKRNYR